MSLTLKEIKKPIDAELQEFEKKFRESMRSSVPLLDRITYYIVKHKGKQMRPMFVFFSALLTGEINESTHRGASLIELMHTATLVHDDVVDDSSKRRGFFSVNALWKNKIAVLVGDYLLSKGLILSVENNEFESLRILSEAVRDMSEGELKQIEKARLLNINEEEYYDIIRRKTASLISSACGVGAASTTEDSTIVDKVKLFGEKIGIAFQIKDDLFDLGTEDVGKPKGIDIKEKKLTLPVIHALAHADKSTRRKMIYIIKNQSNKKSKVQEVIDFVWNSGGIEYAKQAMKEYYDEALAILHSFPEGAGRTGLEQLVEFTINRRK